jgi:hypothetical protein
MTAVILSAVAFGVLMNKYQADKRTKDLVNFIDIMESRDRIRPMMYKYAALSPTSTIEERRTIVEKMRREFYDMPVGEEERENMLSLRDINRDENLKGDPREWMEYVLAMFDMEHDRLKPWWMPSRY